MAGAAAWLFEAVWAVFEITTLVEVTSPLYMPATDVGANNSAALVAASVEYVAEAARRIAATSAGARLDPPMLLALDEVGNSAPSLPTLITEGGGTGIATTPALQSLAQAHEKWSENAAGAI